MSLSDLLNKCERIPGIEIFPVKLPPETSKEILENYNKHNRKKRPKNLEYLAEEMLNNEFYITASGIGFTKKNKVEILCDGQHRLEAAVKTNSTIPVVVVTGLNPDSQQKIDRHARRSRQDVFLLAGYSESGIEIKIGNFLARWEKMKRTNKERNIIIFDYEVKTVLEGYKENIKNVLSHFTTEQKGLSKAGFLAAIVRYNAKEPDESIKFYKQVLSGVMLKEHDPAMRLRRVLTGEVRNIFNVRALRSKGNLAWGLRDYKQTVYCINAFHKCKLIESVREAEHFDF